MIPIMETLRQETKCYGRINGTEFSLSGGGCGRPFDGYVHTSLKSAAGPLHFPCPLLSPVLIMGYPTFSTYHQGAFDLFKLSDGYEYTRRFSFHDGGHMNTVHKVKYHGDHLAGDFRVVDATVSVPDIVAGEPTIETFLPSGPGLIRSSFLMAWRIRGGGFFFADVASEYRLTHNAGLPYLQFRYITFESSYDVDGIEQTECLNVFRDLGRIRLLPESERREAIASIQRASRQSTHLHPVANGSSGNGEPRIIPVFGADTEDKAAPTIQRR
jgi:hypothetical protein